MPYGSHVQPRPEGRVRFRNDSFYDDYLHRGTMELGDFAPQDTPLRHMGYYDYGVHVRVVEGDPHSLAAHQYAFDPHYVIQFVNTSHSKCPQYERDTTADVLQGEKKTCAPYYKNIECDVVHLLIPQTVFTLWGSGACKAGLGQLAARASETMQNVARLATTAIFRKKSYYGR